MGNLWSKRFTTLVQERIFLLRRIANGFSFLPILLLLFGFYYYPQLIEWLPKDAPVTLIVSLIVSWVVTRGKFRSFLFESDILYLTPIEKKMKSFFVKSYIYNVVVQSFFVFALLVVLSPLYLAKISDDVTLFFLLVLIMIILKAWNVLCVWQILKAYKHSWSIVRFILNYIFVYSVFSQNWLLILIATLLFIITVLLIQNIVKVHQIQWFTLIELNDQIDAKFYHTIGQFIDHPKTSSKVNYRMPTFGITKFIGYSSSVAFRYLYVKLFLRTETFWIVTRIMMIGFIVLLFVKELIILVVLYLAILYLIGLQLSGFWQTYKNQFWASFYPYPNTIRIQAFIFMSAIVMLFSSTLLLIPALIHQTKFIYILLLILIALVFTYIFFYRYVAKKIKL